MQCLGLSACSKGLDVRNLSLQTAWRVTVFARNVRGELGGNENNARAQIIKSGF